MMPTSCSLLIAILLLQLVIPGNTQLSLDTIVDRKIKKALQDLNPAVTTISCSSVTRSGKVSSCPQGMVVTGCACGYACGSWDVQGETTCHCQCGLVDWTTARCCHLT